MGAQFLIMYSSFTKLIIFLRSRSLLLCPHFDDKVRSFTVFSSTGLISNESLLANTQKPILERPNSPCFMKLYNAHIVIPQNGEKSELSFNIHKILMIFTS